MGVEMRAVTRREHDERVGIGSAVAGNKPKQAL